MITLERIKMAQSCGKTSFKRSYGVKRFSFRKRAAGQRWSIFNKKKKMSQINLLFWAPEAEMEWEHEWCIGHQEPD